MSDRWSGERYRGIAQLQRTLAERSLRRLVLRGDEHVLDVGCGDGTLTAEVADAVPRGSVLGIDPTASMVEAAQQLTARRPNLAFRLASVLDLPAAVRLDGDPPAYDVVLSFNALHWVHDLAAAFPDLAAVLAPDGTLLVRMVCEGERPSLEDVIAGVCTSPRWARSLGGLPQPYEHRTPEELRGLVEAAGLRTADATVTDERWDFGSRDGFAAWCRGTFGPWTSRLPPDEVGAFVDDALDAYEPVAGEPGVFRFLQLELLATRPSRAQPGR